MEENAEIKIRILRSSLNDSRGVRVDGNSTINVEIVDTLEKGDAK